MIYKNRTLEQHILRLSKSFPVLLLTGPRQVGKTTLLEHLRQEASPARNYVSLDEFGPRTLAMSDPNLFLERYQPPVLIDEIQNAPALLTRIKVIVDRKRENGLYWLTGSQHFALMRGVSESLAGRVAIIKMLGLSQEEEMGFPAAERPFRPDFAAAIPDRQKIGINELFERITRGSFPRFVQPDAPPVQAFHGSYLQTYIERDIRALANIASISAFETFLRLAAARIGQLLNLSDLARDARIAVSTAKEWIAILEASFQVLLLRPYSRNLSKRQIKTPKLYFLDTGLACYLTGWHTGEVASMGAMAGNLFENYVVSEVVKSYWHRGHEAPVWFWRTKEKKEVDLLIEEEGKLFPVEVKITARPDKSMLTGISSLAALSTSLGTGALVCLADDRYPLAKGIEVIPVAYV